MRYISTREKEGSYSASEAIVEGMAPGGGLFVCEEFLHYNLEKLSSMKDWTYGEIAVEVLKGYLEDYSMEEVEECVSGAYTREKFSSPEYTPVVSLEEDLHIMELWHGPTAAFKDMALQLMPRLFAKARRKTGRKKESLILVATSGDTGKAALEGFKDVDGVNLAVFYPIDGVSRIQELQMVTSLGKNLYVAGVRGNFDDCQGEVKRIFRECEIEGMDLSSANSINLGRLLPQIVYYFKGYLQLLRDGKIEAGEEIDFTIPTGNFGNILAGYYAKRMGLPVGQLVCASNINNILTDLLTEGSYDRRREFHKTMSPSMDILISSNLERFLYHMAGSEGNIREIYREFEERGILRIPEKMLTDIGEIMSAGYTSEEECLDTIGDIYKRYGYLMDTHTGVAMKVALEKRKKNKMVVVSTASIYKFPGSVLRGLGLHGDDELQCLRMVEEVSGEPIHRAVRDLTERSIRHSSVVEKKEMESYLKNII